jgi:hypothetical protein
MRLILIHEGFPFLSHRTLKRQNLPSQDAENHPPFTRVCNDDYHQTYKQRHAVSSCDSRRAISKSPGVRQSRGRTTPFLIRSPLRRAMTLFCIITLRQQEEEVDRPHLELANSHTFIQPRQIGRSVQDGTDKHVFYTQRYTISGRKIQASRFPVLSSAFHCVAKTTPARSCRTTPNIAGVERLHDLLFRIRASHPFIYPYHALSSSF